MSFSKTGRSSGFLTTLRGSVATGSRLRRSPWRRTVHDHFNRQQAGQFAGPRKRPGVEIVGPALAAGETRRSVHQPPRDRQIRQRTQDYVKALIDFCGDLGGRSDDFTARPKQRNIQEGWDTGDCFNRAVELFAGCSDLMSDRGGYLLHRAADGSGDQFRNRCGRGPEAGRRRGAPEFSDDGGLPVRTAAEAGSHAEVIARAGSAMRHVHVNDPQSARARGSANFSSRRF